jgi:hypothetical protein
MIERLGEGCSNDSCCYTFDANQNECYRDEEGVGVDADYWEENDD